MLFLLNFFYFYYKTSTFFNCEPLLTLSGFLVILLLNLHNLCRQGTGKDAKSVSKETFQIVSFPRKAEMPAEIRLFQLQEAEATRAFHASFPVYRETPLVERRQTAEALGLGTVYVKDESFRFGLNAFKVLGGSFAIGNCIARRLGVHIRDLPYPAMVSTETREKLGSLTFVTATDGNHGRGVAWTARQLHQHAVVYMPKGSSPERLANIRAEGADATITDLNYDDAVRLAKRQAEEHGWIMVQDTAWPGYEDIPAWIMQGYGTMGYEAWKQLPQKPTHIFLQAGVGSMAGAITGFFTALYGKDRPIITIVEPNRANCLFRTAQADDGKLHFVSGDMNTIMAGLACGEPCTIGWNVLHACADHFISCPDYTAAKGMRILGCPFPGETPVVSGESGAAGFGCLAEMMTNPVLQPLRDALQLNRTSRVLCFSTEGDTDRANYRAVTWDGRYPSGPEDRTVTIQNKEDT